MTTTLLEDTINNLKDLKKLPVQTNQHNIAYFLHLQITNLELLAQYDRLELHHE